MLRLESLCFIFLLVESILVFLREISSYGVMLRADISYLILLLGFVFYWISSMVLFNNESSIRLSIDFYGVYSVVWDTLIPGNF